MERMKWFERRFSLDLPAWMFPNVVERLRGTPARVEEIIHGLSPENLVRRDENRWSIQENIGHLGDLEPLWSGRVQELLEGKNRLMPADLENRKTHEAGHNAGSIQDVLGSFRTLRTALVERLDELDEKAVTLSAVHPRLDQPMRLIDLIFFAAEHDDHHMAEISRLKKLFGR